MRGSGFFRALDAGAGGGLGARILGPVVLRVAAAHVLPHEEIRAVPEFVQVPRDLHGPHGGRQQVEHERDASAGDHRRMR